MKTIMVDDEFWMLREFENVCTGIPDVELVGKFQNPLDALRFAQMHPVDLAFLDVEMPEMDGLTLSQNLRKISPDMIIIFVSAYDKYMAEAFDLDADYYVMKPYTTQRIEQVVKRARLLSKRLKKRVYIKTFGGFDVFADDRPVQFSSAKAKELLAYLVDRKGGVVDTEEGFSILWEDRVYDHESAASYRKVLGRLQDTLRENGIDHILYVFPRGRALNADAVDCDYYQYLDGDPQAVAAFRGEYMSSYSWGEVTLAALYANSPIKFPE